MSDEKDSPSRKAPFGKRPGLRGWFSLSAEPADDVTPAMRKVITALRVLVLVALIVFLLSIFAGNG